MPRTARDSTLLRWHGVNAGQSKEAQVQITHDPDTDILYIALSDTPAADNADIGDYVTVEYGPNGEVVAIELLEASQ